MDKSWDYVRWNPVKWLADRGYRIPWLSFDPTIIKGVTPGAIRRGNQEGNDGTSLHTENAIRQALAPLFHRELYNVKEGGHEQHPGLLPYYTLGWLRVILTFPAGGIEMACGRFPGMRQRVSLSYRVRWAPDDGLRLTRNHHWGEV